MGQTNPALAACGLPVSGQIVSSVTYTLTADCTQTGQLSVSGNSTVTINGAGFSIFASQEMQTNNVPYMFVLTVGSTLNLNNVTIDGAYRQIPALIGTNGGGFSATNVTFRRSYGTNLNVDGAATLSKVLFEYNFSTQYFAGGNAGALNVSSFGGAVSITDAVFRNNEDGGGAIVVSTAGDGSVTTNGCLTFSGNVPYNVFGSWTDNSSGSCSGKIGNDADAVIAPPALLPCGLPGAGNLDSSASYVLRADCDLSGTASTLWWITEGVNISIQGNGYRLSAGSDNAWRWIKQAAKGTLTLRNVIVDHVKTFSFGTLSVDQSTFRDTSDRVFYHDGTATFRNSLFEEITTTRPANNASVLLLRSTYHSSQATFTNAVFRNNTSSGAPVLNATGTSTITLNGCITFENNSPPNYSGDVTDNSSGACGPDIIIGPTGPVPDNPSPSADSTRWPTLENCFQQLGNIGLICRPPNEPDQIIEIWGITPESEGLFIMQVAQSQINAAVSPGLVASSPDGRLAVRIMGAECITRDQSSRPRVTSAECIAHQISSRWRCKCA